MDYLFSTAEETILLANLLKKNDLMAECAGILTHEDFLNKANAQVYEALRQMYTKNIPADPVTLVNHMGQDAYQSIGGMEYLKKLLSSYEGTAATKQYIRIIKEKSNKRHLITACQKAMEQAQTEAEYQEIISTLETAMMGARYQAKKGAVDVREGMEQAIMLIDERQRMGGRIMGITTGYPKIDKATNGLQKGQMMVIAGRPSMGKTAFVLNILTRLPAEHNALMFEMEMDLETIIFRILGISSMVSAKKMSQGAVNENELDIVLTRTGQIGQKNNLFFDTRAGLTLSEIRAEAKRIKIQRGLSVIVIDHIGKIRPENPKASRNDQIGAISNGLKDLANDLEVCVIVLSQLNRGVEQRENKRPQMSDLRDSGNVEQDADSVLLMYRDDYYQKGDLKDYSEPSELEVNVSKNRNGESGVVKLRFDLQTQRIDDYYGGY